MKLSGYDKQTVRITLRDGTVFEGYAVHNSRDYDFHEFGRDESALEIDHWLFFEQDIASAEPIGESDARVWMSRPFHSLFPDHDAYTALERGASVIELPAETLRGKDMHTGDLIRFEDRSDEDEVLYMEVTGIEESDDGSTVMLRVQEAE